MELEAQVEVRVVVMEVAVLVGAVEQQEQTALDFLLRVVKAEVTAVLVDLMEVVVLEAVQSVLFTPGQLVNSHQLV